jgi:hypothetical protein
MSSAATPSRVDSVATVAMCSSVPKVAIARSHRPSAAHGFRIVMTGTITAASAGKQPDFETVTATFGM